MKSTNEIKTDLETRYTNKEIRILINSALHSSGTDYANEPYAQSCALIAQAMIAYNEMTNSRMDNADAKL